MLARPTQATSSCRTTARRGERPGWITSPIRPARSTSCLHLRLRRSAVRGPPGAGHAAAGDERAMFSVGRAAIRQPCGTFAVDAITAYSAFEGAPPRRCTASDRKGQLVQRVPTGVVRSTGTVDLHGRRRRSPRQRAARACLHSRALRHVRDRRRVHRAGLPQPGGARRGTRHPAVRRDGRRDRRPCPPGRDHRPGQCPPAGTHHGRVAGYFLGTGTLGRSRLYHADVVEDPEVRHNESWSATTT